MKKMRFKRVFIALACVLWCCSAFAWKIENGVLYYYGTGVQGVNADGTLNNFPSDIAASDTDGSTVTTIKFVGKFPNGFGGWFTNGGADTKSSITELNFKDADFSATTAEMSAGQYTITNGWACKNFENLVSIVWPENGSMKVLPQHAFENSGIDNLTLPACLTFIGSYAFGQMKKLKTVTFDKNTTSDLFIQTQAFNNTKTITDVFVLCEANIKAEFNAFDFDVTNGQGVVTAVTAALHFPESVTANYANLSHTLDYNTAMDPKLFHEWLVEHRNRANAQGENNGWWEFTNSGSLPDEDETVITGDVILRTYSNYKYGHLAPKGIKAYIVSGITEETDIVDGETKYTYKLELTSVVVIPKQTGVILYGQSNAKNPDGSPTIALTTVNYVDPSFRRSVWESNSSMIKNYLEPTCVNPDVENAPQLVVGPYDLNQAQTAVEFRNFSLAKFSSTETASKLTKAGKTYDNFRGFFRLKKGTEMPDNKAYLHLRSSEFGDAFGGECIVLKDEDYQKARDYSQQSAPLVYEYVEGKNDYWTKAIWENPVTTMNWGKRNTSTNNEVSLSSKYTGEPFFEELEDGTATLIIGSEYVNLIPKNEVYYNLQGVRVDNPTHGVYIKNGKKVIK